MQVNAIPGFSDPFSSLTHLVAAAVFFGLGIALLIHHRGQLKRTFGLIVFVIGVTFALSMSGVFHLLSPGTVGRDVLQRLDHAAIFFLIAATFTPVHLLLFRGILRWGVLLVIWGAAITAIVLKSIYFTDIAEWLGLIMYLALGWIGALSGYFLYRQFGLAFIAPLIYGAVAYTIGAVLEFAQYPVLIPGVIGPHELFHIMVILGISLHWVFIHRVALRTDQ